MFTMWYSLLGIIFSIIFITFDLSCDEIESCDQDVERISRFHAFFIFTLVENILVIVYSLPLSCYACITDQTVFLNEQREEETNV